MLGVDRACPGWCQRAIKNLNAENVATDRVCVFRVRQTIPVQAGPLVLLYLQWIPGSHAPRGPIEKIAGIRFTANGQAVAWKRDPLNVYALHLDIPADMTTLVAQYDYLTPTDPAQGRVVMTPSMLNLQENAVLLYPAGHTQTQVMFDPKVKYPAGWQAGTALDVERREGDTVVYKRVPLEVLADFSVYAGRRGLGGRELPRQPS